MTTDAVVIGTWSGRRGLPPGIEAVLGLGQKMGHRWEVELRWLIVGPESDQIVETAARYGITTVERIQHRKLETFQPDPYVEALAQYCRQRSPRVLLFSQTPDVRLVAPRVAGRLGCGVVMNALDLDVDDEGRLRVTASAFGGDTRAIYTFGDVEPRIAAVMSAATPAEPAAGFTGSAEEAVFDDVDVDLSHVEERVRIVEPAEAQGPRIEDARVIVAGGRGLGSAENYRLVEQLADVLGGVPAATRAIVDLGWVDASRQIGMTGKVAAPELYIAAGISGASQHMMGCSASKTIVAINTDPSAAIFRYARYGIVGNCVDVFPELIRAFARR